MLLVDVADEPVVDRVADELLEASREVLDYVAGYPQLLVLLLAHEAGAVVHSDPDPAFVSPVGAPAVPEASDPDEDAALGHDGGNRLVGAEEVRGVVRKVGARNEPRGAVRFAEFRDRPHRVADDRRVGLRQWDQLIVGMDRLGGLVVPIDIDDSDEISSPGSSTCSTIGRTFGCTGMPFVERSVDQQVVDPGGPRPSNALSAGTIPSSCSSRNRSLGDLIAEVRFDGVFDDRVAVGFHGFRMCEIVSSSRVLESIVPPASPLALGRLMLNACLDLRGSEPGSAGEPARVRYRARTGRWRSW